MLLLIPHSKNKATCSQFKHQIHDQCKKIYIIMKLCPERKKTKTFCHLEINFDRKEITLTSMYIILTFLTLS